MADSKTIGLWTWSDAAPTPTVALVRSTDRDETVESIKLKMIPSPNELYYVVPGADSYSEILPYFLKVTRYPDHEITGVPTQWVHFFDQWRELCARPYLRRAEYSLGNTVVFPSPVQAEWGGAAIQLMATVRREIMCALFGSPTAFGDSKPAGSMLWWKSPAPAIAQIDRCATDLAALCVTASGMQPVVRAIKQVAQYMRRLHSSATGDSLAAGAAYCLAWATVERAEGNYSAACCLVFRALDYLLQSRCVDEGLIIEKGHGLVFRGGGPSNGKPGVMPCYLEMRKAGTIVGSKRTGDLLQDCTDIRNRLMLTHAMYGMSEKSCGEFFTAVQQAAESIDRGSWRSTQVGAQVFLLKGVLSERSLFAFDEDLSTSVVKIDLEQS